MAKAKINPAFTYKTRDGHNVSDVEITNNEIFPVKAVVNGQPLTYTLQGHYYNARETSHLDLIKQPVKKTKPVKEIKVKDTVTIQGNQAIIPHVHHDLIVAWAKNPELEVQWKSKIDKNCWVTDEEHCWNESYEYRFKPEEPKLLTIIGSDGKARSYPEPCREVLKRNQCYFLADTANGFYTSFDWLNEVADRDWLERGLIHLTKEAAELHAKAMLGMD